MLVILTSQAEIVEPSTDILTEIAARGVLGAVFRSPTCASPHPLAPGAEEELKGANPVAEKC